jgi:hypothetical protein
MTKNRWSLVGCLIALIGVLLGNVALLLPRPGITKANLDRIENGMALEEVERIFGNPGKPARGAILYNWKPGDAIRAWHSDDGLAMVVFDDQMRVRSKWWHDRTRLTYLERFRRWMRDD